MAIEEPKFSIVLKNKFYEIRRYGSVLVAQTQVADNFEAAGNKAFRILASYIFGDNKSKSKIAMTAPVNQIQGSEGFLVEFTMPKHFSIDTIASPNDKRIKLRELSPRDVAVYRYSGVWSQELFNQKLEIFREQLKADGVQTVGEPIFARFDSPFRLWFLRRNEIWLELTSR
jgi:hypothetical protein